VARDRMQHPKPIDRREAKQPVANFSSTSLPLSSETIENGLGLRRNSTSRPSPPRPRIRAVTLRTPSLLRGPPRPPRAKDPAPSTECGVTAEAGHRPRRGGGGIPATLSSSPTAVARLCVSSCRPRRSSSTNSPIPSENKIPSQINNHEIGGNSHPTRSVYFNSTKVLLQYSQYPPSTFYHSKTS
jgi:hypothetical protein